MSLEVDIKCRVEKRMKIHLQEIAKQEGSGIKMADLIRRALEKTYPYPEEPTSDQTHLKVVES